jgi:hypothetical protein
VTQDLYEGLRCISTVNGCQYLWVDAICISQNNDVEKAHQVANMHEVYRQAADVYVWLGPAANKSDQAMEDVTCISNMFEDVDFRHLSSRPDIRAFANWEPESTKFHLRPLYHLMSRRWCSRLWAYQEVMLARDGTIFCGYAKKDLSSFLEFATLMHRTGFVSWIEEEVLGTLGRLAQLRSAKEAREHLGFSRFVSEVLSTRGRQVTDPLDRVYALLGIADKPGAVYRSEIAVDYSPQNKAAGLYVQFGKLTLRNEKHLRLLSPGSAKDPLPAGPSWCPNLDSQTTTRSLSGYYAAGWPAKNHQCGLISSDGQIRHTIFKDKRDCYVEVSPSSNVIKVWGTRLDTVIEVGDNRDTLHCVLRSTDDWAAYAKNWIKWIDDNLDLCQRRCEQSPDAIFKTYWRTLVGNVTFDRLNPCGEEQEESYHASRRYFDTLISTINANNSPEDIQKDRPLVDSLKFHMEYLWQGRRLFVTTKGRIGFGSEHVRPGDQLCILYSGQPTYMLRRNPGQDNYTFLHEAYTHGLMQGEAFDLLDRGEATEELFAIE